MVRDLAEALRADPDDVAAYLVYADELQSEGNPRGELIAVHHALVKDAASEVLRGRAAALLEEHSVLLLGSLATHPQAAEIAWRLGFIERVRLDARGCVRAKIAPGAVLAELHAHPSGMLLRDIELDGGSTLRWAAQVRKALAGLLTLTPRPPLRSLTVGSRALALDWDLGPLYARFPDLRALRVSASDGLALAGLRAPRLTELEVVHGAFTPALLDEVLSAKLPELRSLTLDMRRSDLGVAELSPILRGKVFPQVTRLGLFGCADTAALVRALVRSKVLPRLTDLGVSFTGRGYSDDEEVAAALVEAKDALAHVRFFFERDLSSASTYNSGLVLRTDLKRPAEALAVYEQALKLAPDDADIWLEKGNTLDDLTRFDESVAALTKATKLEPKGTVAYTNLGAVYKGAGQFAVALGYYETAARLGETGASTWHCIGHMQQELGRTAEAERTLRKAIKLYDAEVEDEQHVVERAGLLFWRGAAHALLGNKKDALGDLTRAVKGDAKLKEEAKTENDYQKYRGDPAFRRLVGLPPVSLGQPKL